MMKFMADRPFADPDAAARKIVEIANDVEAVQNRRIYIVRVNAPFRLAVPATISAPGSSAPSWLARGRWSRPSAQSITTAIAFLLREPFRQGFWC